jgi:hypothetical protein
VRLPHWQLCCVLLPWLCCIPVDAYHKVSGRLTRARGAAVMGQAMEVGACMTDVMAATTALASCEGPATAAAREEALAHFYSRHAKGNDLLICKWLSVHVGREKIHGAERQIE